MSSYYAKIETQLGSGERLVAVTGQLQGGLLRVVDVDMQGNPVGSQTYLPANVEIIELEKGADGLLQPIGGDNELEESIDWAAHEDKVTYNEDGEPEVQGQVSSVSPTNPAMAAFPELSGE